ncbi:MAG: hypothetical protein ABIH40_06130 [Candidatus Omnitrophota bacterium]
MKTVSKFLITVTVSALVFCGKAEAHSVRHHLINMGKSLVRLTFSPLYGVFVKGPKNIKEAYEYEVYGSEKPEEKGLLRKKLFAFWRSPGEEAKGAIDGLVDSVDAGGRFMKEFLSIFFSD